MSRQHHVEVWGVSVPVDVYQKSKSVWIASGAYMGKHIETKDRSAGSALLRWKDAARYAGN
jgi:hypothetical protein